jgi:hypothetical protein
VGNKKSSHCVALAKAAKGTMIIAERRASGDVKPRQAAT